MRSWRAEVAGKEIEVYSLGLDGWTALNEATYLASRISAYDPDIVLAVMFRNDITDSGGVLGNGLVSYGFSPEARDAGSGVMIGASPNLFGIAAENLLFAGMGTESTSRWTKTFAAWKRLQELVEQNGGKMLFSVLGDNALFAELCKHYFDRAGMTSPFLLTRYFNQRLPHDPHPSREGHRILAVHYLHALSALGWLPVAAEDLPDLDRRLDLETVHRSDPERSRELQKSLADRVLASSIEFDRLDRNVVRSMLGGIYPGSASDRLGTHPFATPRSAFLLGAREGSASVTVEIEVPPYVELYPFELTLKVNGRVAATLGLASVDEAGRHLLAADLVEEDRQQYWIEIVLTTDSYWTGINDDVMRSYVLISARQG